MPVYKNKRYVMWVIAIVGFIAALYLTEYPPYGKASVKLHNDGYGTFDMTNYDGKIVESVLKNTDDMQVYYKYYICDFIFIAMFAFFQYMVTTAIGKLRQEKILRVGFVLIAVRALLDAIENVSLIIVTNNFPALSYRLVNLSSIITKFKFICMGAWFVTIIVMMIVRKRKPIRTGLHNENF
ncbi:hypothetical protein Ana3638_12500 [Anaerocolumna sedimenticola]|uniref:Uncharacterized protein n=1 Tax=Anaerocolumna sedimenticola TaxID=2696063 RepID=A0A6P1TK81_9FIRM|nr:hypothetical protein [Anaerocolumna sedimenticola]QHQ61494.1 hypothetical protein Ana3638_12500 [Anaerocolumna sedimenticola]